MVWPVFLLALMITWAAAPVLFCLLGQKHNYRGVEVAFPAGVVPVAGFILALLGHLGDSIDVLLGMGIVALAGLADDMLGSGEEKGLRGHLGALRQRRLTTGMVKVGAALVAGLGVVESMGFSPGRCAASTALILLCTNAVNLFDLRPGRAGKVVAAVALGLAVGGRNSLAAALAGAVLAYLPFDLREEAMLGDTGANALGFLTGVLLVQSLGLPGELAAVAILTVLHWYAERRSVSCLIARHPVLDYLDWLGRRREIN